MNQGLLRAVRQRTSSQTSDDLLRLWVENDRGTYSPETFEAVRSLLAERGVTLPPQNDPPPMATAVPPPVEMSLEPAWTSRLRPLLWLGAAIAVARLLSWAGLCWQYVEIFQQSRFDWTDWRTEAMLAELSLSLALPVCLLAGVWAALRRRRRARRILWAYILASLGLTALHFGFAIYRQSDSWSGIGADYLMQQPEALLLPNVYALVLLVLLRRTRALAPPEPEEPGFEVAPAAAAAPAPDSASARAPAPAPAGAATPP